MRSPSGSHHSGMRGRDPVEMSTARHVMLPEGSWDQEAVAARLEEAVDVLARLPDERVHGHYDLWPKLIGAAGRQVRPAAAAPEAIDRMDETLGWLMWLEPEERQLLWLRAEGMPWKWITRRLGIGRHPHRIVVHRPCH